MKRLATAKVSVGNRISLTQEVCKTLDVKQGDIVAVCKTDDGKIELLKVALPA